MIISKTEINEIAQRINLLKFKNESILITGATGMIGSYLLETLLTVGLIQDFQPKEIKVISFRGDFSKIEHLCKFKNLKFESLNLDSPHPINGYDYVIHAASPASPKFFLPQQEMNRINGGVLEYLVSKDTKDLLYISSGEVYGIEHKKPIKENDIIGAKYDPRRATYPVSKIKAEETCKLLYDKYSVDYKIARLFHSFGPGLRENDGRSFADFLWRAARGQNPILNSDGTDVRTFLYSLDCVVGLLLLLTSNERFNKVNVGSKIPLTIFEFANIVSLIAGLGGINKEQKGVYKRHDIKVIIPDIEKLSQLGWTQNYDIERTISMTLNWIKRSKEF